MRRVLGALPEYRMRNGDSSEGFSLSVEAMDIEAAALPSPARRWYALAILTAVYTSNIADRFVISTLIQPIKHDLNLSDTAIGFLTGTALAIFYTGLGLPLGALADRVDRRKLI